MSLDAALTLMAVEPLPRKDWQLHTCQILKSAGLNIRNRNREVLAWKEVLASGGLRYSNGWLVRPMWLAPGRRALGVTCKRFYFAGRDDIIDDRAEHIVVGENRPESPLALEQLGSVWGLVQILKHGLHPSTTQVVLQDVNLDLGLARVVKIGSNTCLSPPNTLNSLYKEYGFDMVPQNFTVDLCPVQGVSDQKADEFRKRLEQTGIQRHTKISVRRIAVHDVFREIDGIRNAGEGVRNGCCTLFILPAGKQEVQKEVWGLFKSLEDRGVPFRRAYADDPLTFSIPDQFPSLLMAAGGRPHRTPTHVSGKEVWTIGVDLSHRLDSPLSTLAVTLVDPDGGLVGAWTKEQTRDETVRVETISSLLKLCGQQLTGFSRKSRVLVIRDGRMFENEDSRLYEEILDTDVSLLEYRKRGNPQFAFVHKEVHAINGPSAATVPGTTTMFLTTVAPQDNRALPAVSKITWRKEWNGLALTATEIASLLVASSAAPGLGLHARHLPAAIYWADGIAGANPEDLRFVGVLVEKIH